MSGGGEGGRGLDLKEFQVGFRVFIEKRRDL